MEIPRKIAVTKLNSSGESNTPEPTTYAVQNRKNVMLPTRVKQNLLYHAQILTMGPNQ